MFKKVIIILSVFLLSLTLSSCSFVENLDFDFPSMDLLGDIFNQGEPDIDKEENIPNEETKPENAETNIATPQPVIPSTFAGSYYVFTDIEVELKKSGSYTEDSMKEYAILYYFYFKEFYFVDNSKVEILLETGERKTYFYSVTANRMLITGNGAESTLYISGDRLIQEICSWDGFLSRYCNRVDIIYEKQN